jgi:hypothetical protein
LNRFAFVAAGLAIYLGTRFLTRRRERHIVRLRNGRRVKLLSSVALLDRSDGDLLALEYASELPDPTPEELRLEAGSLLQAVGARAEYSTCRAALVSVHRATFTFLRGDAGPGWYPAEGLPE